MCHQLFLETAQCILHSHLVNEMYDFRGGDVPAVFSFSSIVVFSLNLKCSIGVLKSRKRKKRAAKTAIKTKTQAINTNMAVNANNWSSPLRLVLYLGLGNTARERESIGGEGGIEGSRFIDQG